LLNPYQFPAHGAQILQSPISIVGRTSYICREASIVRLLG
jgi:hypothetical protein